MRRPVSRGRLQDDFAALGGVSHGGGGVVEYLPGEFRAPAQGGGHGLVAVCEHRVRHVGHCVGDVALCVLV